MAETTGRRSVLQAECDHVQVDYLAPNRPGDMSDWRCRDCGQGFVPCLDQPVLVGDWSKPRLNVSSDWRSPGIGGLTEGDARG